MNGKHILMSIVPIVILNKDENKRRANHWTIFEKKNLKQIYSLKEA